MIDFHQWDSLLIGLDGDDDAIGRRETLNNNNGDKKKNKREEREIERECYKMQ